MNVQNPSPKASLIPYHQEASLKIYFTFMDLLPKNNDIHEEMIIVNGKNFDEDSLDIDLT